MPTYNSSRFIDKQLRALDKQTYLAFDVVVSDNGSSDRTREIVESWEPAFNSIRCVDSSGRKGAAHARNVGAQSVTSDILLMCDSDDAVDPNWVSAHLEALQDADASTGPLRIVMDIAGETISIWNRESLPVAMNFLPYLPSGNAGFKRHVYKALGGFDERLWRGHEDVDLGWRLMLAGYAISHSPEASIAYVQRASWASRTKQQYKSGRAFAQLYAKHAQEAIPVQSFSWRVRWWAEWLKQHVFVPKRWTEVSPTLAFQLGRSHQSLALGVRSPMW